MISTVERHKAKEFEIVRNNVDSKYVFVYVSAYSIDNEFEFAIFLVDRTVLLGAIRTLTGLDSSTLTKCTNNIDMILMHDGIAATRTSFRGGEKYSRCNVFDMNLKSVLTDNLDVIEDVLKDHNYGYAFTWKSMEVEAE